MFNSPSSQPQNYELTQRTLFMMNNSNTLPLPPQQHQQNQNQNQSSSSCYSPFNFPSNGFTFFGDELMINNNMNHHDLDHDHHHHHHQLSLDLSKITLSDEDHQPNNNIGTRISGNNNVVLDSNNKINMPDFWESNAYNNMNVEDVTVTSTDPRYQNMGNQKSTTGFSLSQGLVSDMKWGMQKGTTFGVLPQMGSSIDLGNNVGLSYGGERGNRVFQVQLQNPPPYEQQPLLYPPSRASAFAIENVCVNNASYYPSSNNHFLHPTTSRNIQEPLAFKCDNSFIIQENPMKTQCNNSLLGHDGGVGGVTTKYSYSQPQSIPQVPPFTRRFMPELQSYMYHMAKDQNGCRFLQNMVEGTVEDMELVFNGVIDNVVELMMDPFGNYLVQKLLENCRDNQRLQIVLMLTKEPGQLIRCSLNTHGTRVVQMLISTLKSRRQIALVRNAIQPGFLDLIKDMHGNHVIQRCLSCLSFQDNEFIYQAATKRLVDVATHQHGCCVLQRCIEFSEGKTQLKLLKEISKHAFLLAQDPYGNYVVQYVIELENPMVTPRIADEFKGNYVTLSTQKFSSHVVEKCLNYIVETRATVCQEFLSFPHFERLLQDPFANYVIQRVLEYTKGYLHASLVEAVRAHKMLRTSPYCKRIFSKTLPRN